VFQVAPGGIYGPGIKIHGKGLILSKDGCGKGEDPAATSGIKDPPLTLGSPTMLATKEFIKEEQG
jgi:hypothetical protein